ncbi:hypothetical protein GQ53DRAFT_652203 [Thozetella sp. PMI_491]|nr:hypothetical protein GQ53DRAFT_652203 [Thozetella sp. PMI_491]
MAGKRKSPEELSQNPSTKRVRARQARMNDNERTVQRATSALNTAISRARKICRDTDEWKLANDDARKQLEEAAKQATISQR